MREIIKYQQIVWKKWQQKSRLFEDWSPKRQPLNLPLKRGWVDTWYQQAIKRQPANGIPHLPCRAGGSTSKSSVQPHVTIKPILVCIDSWLQHVGRENVDCTKHDPGPSEKSALPQPSTPHVQLTNLEYIWANQSISSICTSLKKKGFPCYPLLLLLPFRGEGGVFQCTSSRLPAKEFSVNQGFSRNVEASSNT